MVIVTQNNKVVATYFHSIPSEWMTQFKKAGYKVKVVNEEEEKKKNGKRRKST